MRALVLVVLVAAGLSFSLAVTANAVPDYIKKYWEARQPHNPPASDQSRSASPPPNSGN